MESIQYAHQQEDIAGHNDAHRTRSRLIPSPRLEGHVDRLHRRWSIDHQDDVPGSTMTGMVFETRPESDSDTILMYNRISYRQRYVEYIFLMHDIPSPMGRGWRQL